MDESLEGGRGRSPAPACSVPSREFLASAVLAIGPECPREYGQRAVAGGLRMAHFERCERLGRGACSTVYRVEDRVGGAPTAALKVYDLDKLDSRAIEHLVSEIRLHTDLVHPHIAPVWAVFVDSTELGILMPMARHGSLSQRAGDLHQDEGVVARYMVWPILSAVCHIHARGIVHRDIKRENILIDARGSVLVSDFSFATECSRPPVSFVGTQCAMSPELIFSGCPPNPESPLRVNVPHDQRTPYGRSVDVWALGVLTYELVTGTRLFVGMDFQAMAQGMAAASYHNTVAYGRLSPPCRDFIDKCLVWDPSRRSLAADLYLHPFITSNVQLEQWKTLHPKMQRGSREGPGQSGLLRDDLREFLCAAVQKVHRSSNLGARNAQAKRASDCGDAAGRLRRPSATYTRPNSDEQRFYSTTSLRSLDAEESA